MKRKSIEAQLKRRLRARPDTPEETEEISSDSEILTVDDSSSSSQKDEGENDLTIDKGDKTLGFSEAVSATHISFGALANAQAAIVKPDRGTKGDEVGARFIGQDRSWQDNEALDRNAGRKNPQDMKRANKHAPAEVSSKKAVSRKREVIPLIKREYRDPRFEPLSGPLNESKLQKVYSFLDDYRDKEISELKAAIKKAKDGTEKENLKRVLLSLESKKGAQEKKRKEKEILNRHRKKEKELVKQGKKPFYLKKEEQRRQLLLERYGELKGKQLDRVIARRRKKEERKEKKKLPWSRRDAGADTYSTN